MEIKVVAGAFRDDGQKLVFKGTPGSIPTGQKVHNGGDTTGVLVRWEYVLNKLEGKMQEDQEVWMPQDEVIVVG